MKELSRLDGGILRSSEKMEDSSLHYFTTFYHPANTIFYRDEKVIYQVFQMSDSPHPGIFVYGYKRSEPYINDSGIRSIKVDPIKKENCSELEKILKRHINPNWPINILD